MKEKDNCEEPPQRSSISVIRSGDIAARSHRSGDILVVITAHRIGSLICTAQFREQENEKQKADGGDLESDEEKHTKIKLKPQRKHGSPGGKNGHNDEYGYPCGDASSFIMQSLKEKLRRGSRNGRGNHNDHDVHANFGHRKMQGDDELGEHYNSEIQSSSTGRTNRLTRSSSTDRTNRLTKLTSIGSRGFHELRSLKSNLPGLCKNITRKKEDGLTIKEYSKLHVPKTPHSRIKEINGYDIVMLKGGYGSGVRPFCGNNLEDAKSAECNWEEGAESEGDDTENYGKYPECGEKRYQHKCEKKKMNYGDIKTLDGEVYIDDMHSREGENRRKGKKIQQELNAQNWEANAPGKHAELRENIKIKKKKKKDSSKSSDWSIRSTGSCAKHSSYDINEKKKKKIKKFRKKKKKKKKGKNKKF
ncbi:hypothetical protein POVCU2_0002700 [Plasmodium ovale curtisi]|uniref:Uncharacterized protein n=1 Tax=Plasmodium ovale curtisi TaxID=864141 RepID=A0A1A8VI08_PLAOA|nr:hypothetical protein POVCU2_0002700 [Plasmodium ovale curtisi]